MSKPWGATKEQAKAGRPAGFEMSDWLLEMLNRGAERAASEPRTELKERAAELYAQLRPTIEDA